MSSNITDVPSADPETVTAEGELLSRIYRTLVPIHASLATADAINRDFQRRLMHEIMDVLREIAENPEFRAADDAEHERWSLNPTPEELAAQERGRAVVERWRRAREERRASEQADASGG